MTQRRGRRTEIGGVKENGDEVIVVPTIHDPSVKLPYVDEGIESLDGDSWPRRVKPVRKEDWPKSGGFPNRKDDDTAGTRRNGKLFPRCDEFANWRTKEKALIGPTDREGVSGRRTRISVTRVKALATRVGGGCERIHGKTRRQETGL